MTTGTAAPTAARCPISAPGGPAAIPSETIRVLYKEGSAWELPRADPFCLLPWSADPICTAVQPVPPDMAAGPCRPVRPCGPARAQWRVMICPGLPGKSIQWKGAPRQSTDCLGRGATPPLKRLYSRCHPLRPRALARPLILGWCCGILGARKRKMRQPPGVRPPGRPATG